MLPAAMALSHFEKRIEDELKNLDKAIWLVDPRDSVRIAELRGQRQAFETSVKLYRNAAGADLEGGDI